MAITFFSGFETGDFSEFSSISGSPTVQGTIKNTGSYAMRCNTDATWAYVYSGNLYAWAISFYIQVNTAPNALAVVFGATGTNALSVRLETDRTLKFYAGETVASTSSPMDLGTWYRVSFDLKGTSWNAWLNGSLLSGFPYTTSGITYSNGYLGIKTAVTADLYFDDYIEGDATGNDLGDIRVLRASPNAAGQYAEFDTISGYTNCDEVPASDADYVDDSGVEALHRECYNLQNCATIGLGGSDTIKAVNVWIRLYDNNTLQGIIVRDNSVDYKTMKAVGKAYKWTNVLYDTNAPRASAWTQAIFDAFQSGGYSEGKNDVYMSCVMDMVAFIPAVAPPPAAYFPRSHGYIIG